MERPLDPPLVFPNETPALYYTRYLTNASRIQVFFGDWENAKKFSAFIQNRSVVVFSYGFSATVLMRREDMRRALELADYWNEAELPPYGYGNPQEVEQRNEALDFLLSNYDFPEPIRNYLLNEKNKMEEQLNSIKRARSFIQSHRGLSYYEITVLEPSSVVKKNLPDMSWELAVLVGVEVVLFVILFVENDKRIRALLSISILVLMVPVYELSNYERALKDHEAVRNYILRMPEKGYDWTSPKDINGSVGISCFVKNTQELKRILEQVNSTEVVVERSLRGNWVSLRFTGYVPGRFLQSKKCYLDTYGYKCPPSVTPKELSVINETRKIIQEITADKRYLVERALSQYNLTLMSCDRQHSSFPPGEYIVSLMIMPDRVEVPSLFPTLDALILAMLLLFSTFLFSEER
ncbi:hypothetical protein [Palaeococcus ferrophilus]|uniref:hypothetical protein n=1 Tax=Palaeococcus ferrophilus TaxID=83868 RepID=UPI00064FB2B5|nr:hypothetical protein [Palaeococcus ferrophilus]